MHTELLTALSTYLIIILAELGDKTQVAVLLITSSNPHRRWTIFAASALALFLCVLIEVTVGVTLARHIAPHVINKFAGLIFLIIGIITLVKNMNIRLSERNIKERRPERVAEQTR